MKYQLVVEYSEKPRIFWPMWDAVWIALESFWAGMSFMAHQWWAMAAGLVFAVAFTIMLAFHLKTMTFLNWSIKRLLDGKEESNEQADQ